MHTVKTGLVLALLVLGACGGGTSTPSSGVDGSKSIASLGDTEKGELCDWINNMLGGYNQAIICNGQTVDSSESSQAECVQSFPTCSVMVSQYQSCIQMLISNECSDTGTTSAMASADCQASADCL